MDKQSTPPKENPTDEKIIEPEEIPKEISAPPPTPFALPAMMPTQDEQDQQQRMPMMLAPTYHVPSFPRLDDNSFNHKGMQKFLKEVEDFCRLFPNVTSFEPLIDEDTKNYILLMQPEIFSKSFEEQRSILKFWFRERDPNIILRQLSQLTMRSGPVQYFRENLTSYISRFAKLVNTLPDTITKEFFDIRKNFSNGLSPPRFRSDIFGFIKNDTRFKTLTGCFKETEAWSKVFAQHSTEHDFKSRSHNTRSHSHGNKYQRPRHYVQVHQHSNRSQNFSRSYPHSNSSSHDSPHSKQDFQQSKPDYRSQPQAASAPRTRYPRKIICHNCGEEGHKVYACPKPRRNNHDMQTRSKGDVPNHTSQVIAPTTAYDLMKFDIEISKKVHGIARLDSGSNNSLVDRKFLEDNLQKSGIKFTFHKTPTSTCQADGTPAKIFGSAVLDIRNPANGIELTHPFNVMNIAEEGVDFLIGSDLIFDDSDIYPIDSKALKKNVTVATVEEFQKLCTCTLPAPPTPGELEEKIAQDAEQADLTPTQTEELTEVLLEQAELFGPLTEEPAMPETQFTITLKDPSVNPVYIPPRRLTPDQVKFVEEQIQDWLSVNAIRPSTSGWSSPIVIVKKKNGDDRFCVDFRKLNALTVRDAQPLPRIIVILDSLGGNMYFATFDFYSGFNQLAVDPECTHLLAFATHDGLYEFVRMPFGLMNAPACFQRAINNLLSNLRHFCCEVYLDDVIVFGKTWEEFLSNLKKVLARLASGNVRLNLKKCSFGQKEVEFLGNVVSAAGRSISSDRIQGLADMKAPTDIKQLRSFLGLASYYRDFLPNLSMDLEPLSALTRKGTPFNWTGVQQKAFQDTLDKLCSSCNSLVFPDWNKPFILRTDACDYGIGAVLLQDNDTALLPVVHISRSLTESERKWSIVEKEAFAIVWSCRRLNPYLSGRKFLIQTDHKNLSWIHSSSNARVRRWSLEMSELDYEIEYLPGSKNEVADALSRVNPPTKNEPELQTQQVFKTAALAPIPDPILEDDADDDTELENDDTETEEEEEETPAHAPPQEEEEAPSDDSLLSDWFKLENIIKYTQEAQAEMSPDDARYLVNNPAARQKHVFGHSVWQINSLTFIPSHCEPLKANIIALAHDFALYGHGGILRTKKRILEAGLTWRGLAKDVKAYVSSCVACQKVKASLSQMSHGQMQDFRPTRPHQSLNIDFLKMPKSKDGKQYILVMIDRFSRWVELRAVANADARTTVQCLIESIFCRHGIPEQIMSDQGPHFANAVMKELAEVFEFSQLLTTPYHPKANGSAERVNSIILRTLKILSRGMNECWPDYVAALQMSMNSAYSTPIGMSPFELLYGHPPRTPITAMNPSLPISFEEGEDASDPVVYAQKIKSLLANKAFVALEA
jgi:transposase InsO family protein